MFIIKIKDNNKIKKTSGFRFEICDWILLNKRGCLECLINSVFSQPRPSYGPLEENSLFSKFDIIATANILAKACD